MGVVMPACGKFKSRLDDFKKYGLVNIGNRKVLLNLLFSNEDVEDAEKGWHENIKVRVVRSDCPNYVSNIYRFYAKIDPENIECRWLARVDDDSCTDVDGLVSNLDEFYDWRESFYLASSPTEFRAALDGDEGNLFPEYSHLLENYGRISHLLKNEIESGVISAFALNRIMKNEDSVNLIKFRSKLYGGYGDCVVAVAAALAKVYPIDCPFMTHLPELHNFSLVGGVLNHIHMIARNLEGENFTWDRASNEQFVLLTKIIDKNPTEVEKSLEGSRFLFETKDVLTTYEFKPNHVLRAKFENCPFMWMEQDGLVYVFKGNELVHKLSLDASGNLSDGRTTLKRI